MGKADISLRGLLWIAVRVVGTVAQASNSLLLTSTPTLDASGCRGGVTTFGACNSMVSTIAECGANKDLSMELTCFCTQDVFNLFYDCENEARLCLQSPEVDSNIANGLANWHVACDGLRRTVSLTTPAISSLTTTIDFGPCREVYEGCESAILESQSCVSGATAATDLLSCFCQPKVMSLYSICDYDRNVSCLAISGNTDLIPGHSFCPRFSTATNLLATDITAAVSIFDQTWTPVASTQNSSLSTTYSSIVDTITAKPVVPTLSTTPSPSTSTTSSGADRTPGLVIEVVIVQLAVGLIFSRLVS